METPQFIIRPAAVGDIDALVALRGYLLDGASQSSYASRNAEESLLWKTTYKRWLEQATELDDGICILAAEHGGELVGCATGIVDTRPPARDCLSGRCGWVQSVVVAPEWRRRGIALQLMGHLLDWFATLNVAKVALESTPEAEALYMGIGFVQSRERLLIREESKP